MGSRVGWDAKNYRSFFAEGCGVGGSPRRPYPPSPRAVPGPIPPEPFPPSRPSAEAVPRVPRRVGWVPRLIDLLEAALGNRT